MQKFRIALIGYGSIGRLHALGYRAIPFHYGLPADQVQIVGVATSRPESAQKAGQEIGCEAWTGDYRELLARKDVDVVDICTPNDRHCVAVLAAAEAGKHIMPVPVPQGHCGGPDSFSLSGGWPAYPGSVGSGSQVVIRGPLGFAG